MAQSPTRTRCGGHRAWRILSPIVGPVSEKLRDHGMACRSGLELARKRTSLAPRQLRRVLRFGLGDRRRVLELAGVIARLALEAREILAAERGAQRELLG